MPTISVKPDKLFKIVGRTYSAEDFDELCFKFGIELEKVENETNSEGKEEVIYKIDIPANRTDLLCVEGLGQALSVFINRIPAPRFIGVEPADGQLAIIKVGPNVAKLRPHCIGAVLRDITIDNEAYKSFIDLQEKLHQNIGRKRTLVAIGTHDLDSIKGPFTYDAYPPEQIKFVPLNESKEFTAHEMMEMYSRDHNMRQYVPIIRDSPVYPVIKDANGVVLSMPPIINGNHTKISTKTKHVLIELTATDLTKAEIVLDTLITAFSGYCKKPFTAEKVKIIRNDGSSVVYPKLEYREQSVNADKINKFIGISESVETIASYLSAMGLQSEKIEGTLDINVIIPPTRHDIIHPVDIYEDAAIVHGYDNIEKTSPKIVTIAQQNPLNELTIMLRRSLAEACFTETVTYTLCSHSDITEKLRHQIESQPAIHIANPKTLEFQVGRTTLLPGVLKTINANQHMPLPLRLFEISDVILKDPKKDVGARNERRLCAINYDKTSGFEVIHGLLDRIMTLLEVKPKDKDPDGYHLECCQDPTYFSGFCANVIVRGQHIGLVGVLHPEVIERFGLKMPAAALEINIEPFV
ncbi:phenylalanine--tRNA ligase beta subunit-like [Artemia franciscana]|uniref:Phenylalanine--tRNA ligase beta subunit n=1 Tax=Artemia franciscana TaxID=6661 RepID=A0AA88IDF0_ARTSF|nr:hypothetical protein QYM36_000843 [Artemia franciscana]